MNIKVCVTGGTDKTVRSDLMINDEKVGELQINRLEFTKFCDLLFESKYMIGGEYESQ